MGSRNDGVQDVSRVTDNKHMHSFEHAWFDDTGLSFQNGHSPLETMTHSVLDEARQLKEFQHHSRCAHILLCNFLVFDLFLLSSLFKYRKKRSLSSSQAVNGKYTCWDSGHRISHVLKSAYA